MPTPQEYLLTFDFTSFTSQFTNLNKSFTDFGETIHKIAGQVSGDMKGLQDQANTLFTTLSNMGMLSDTGFKSFEKHMKETSGYLEEYQKKSSEISQKLKDISNTDISKLAQAAGGGGDPGSVHERTEDVMPGGVKGSDPEGGEEAEKQKSKLDELMSKMDEVDKKFAGLDKKLEEMYTHIWDKVKKEMSQAKSKATSIFSQLTGGLLSGGGILTMALGFMMLGYKEKDRKASEAGEMLNVFEASTSDFFAKSTKHAANWFSSFQEKAQWYYGIGRQEVQSTIKTMIDAGYTTDQIMNRFDKKLGEVGRNVVTLTLGLDKHFNLATGTSAQNVNNLVSNYGDTLEDAADKYVKLSFAAQRSGMGVSKFVDAVMSGSQALTQYGIDLNDVAQVMGTLKKHYQEMGLDKQYAGSQAAGALGGITQGIAGFGIGMQVIVAQRMFPKAANALESRQKFLEGWQRVAKGEDKGFLIDAVQTAVRYAKEQTGGSREESIYFLEQQGLTSQAATAAVDVAEKLEKGAEIQDLGNKETKALREAFLTEGKAVSEMQKNQRDLIDGLAQVGKGLLKIMSGILGTLVLGFKWLTTLPARLMMKPGDEADKLDAQINAAFDLQFASMGKGLDEVTEGAGKVGGAMKGIFEDAFGSLSAALNTKFGDDKRGFVDAALDGLARGLAQVNKRVDLLWDIAKDPLNASATIDEFQRKQDIRNNDPAIRASVTGNVNVGLSKQAQETQKRWREQIKAGLYVPEGSANASSEGGRFWIDGEYFRASNTMIKNRMVAGEGQDD
ncbi:MAG: hypothetical protein WC441_05325 [Patescibacteria group bacterium]